MFELLARADVDQRRVAGAQAFLQLGGADGQRRSAILEKIFQGPVEFEDPPARGASDVVHQGDDGLVGQAVTGVGALALPLDEALASQDLQVVRDVGDGGGPWLRPAPRRGSAAG